MPASDRTQVFHAEKSCFQPTTINVNRVNRTQYRQRPNRCRTANSWTPAAHCPHETRTKLLGLGTPVSLAACSNSCEPQDRGQRYSSRATRYRACNGPQARTLLCIVLLFLDLTIARHRRQRAASAPRLFPLISTLATELFARFSRAEQW